MKHVVALLSAYAMSTLGSNSSWSRWSLKSVGPLQQSHGLGVTAAPMGVFCGVHTPHYHSHQPGG